MPKLYDRVTVKGYAEPDKIPDGSLGTIILINEETYIKNIYGGPLYLVRFDNIAPLVPGFEGNFLTKEEFTVND